MEHEEYNPIVLIFSEDELKEKRDKFLSFIEDKCSGGARTVFPDYIKDWKKMKYGHGKHVYVYKTAVLEIPCKYIKPPYKNRKPLYWSLARDVELDRERYSREISFYGLDKTLKDKNISYADFDKLMFEKHGSYYKLDDGEIVSCLFGGEVVQSVEDFISNRTVNKMSTEYLVMCSKYLETPLRNLVEFHYPGKILEHQFDITHLSLSQNNSIHSDKDGDFIFFRNVNILCRENRLYSGYKVDDFYNINNPNGDCYPLSSIRMLCYYFGCTIDDLISYSNTKV